ncbi:GDSL esterase/lipase EXL3-like isoform X2 [Corylus avellana]|uniref:GDSL esterase/lipase EXL3-like isoform X2 n=1 Tax=Corylus avellana TaxID=13451 RepID=UPI00286AF7B1|nr:GDSL esterase/lipase EXL3-like isoform X2 [Corylus avellana]
MKSSSQKPLSSSSNIVFSITIFIISLNTAGSAATMPKNEPVPAVIVFGDSIVDPGNNNNIDSLIKCNFPPYGRDFIGGQPTGRFSDGRVPSDLIAELFGVKKLLPAYLDPNLQLQDLLTGVSFASGGAGYDPLTAKIVSVLSLSDQVEMFKDYIKKIKTAVGEDRTATLLSKGIFIVCTGSDDIANTYFSTPSRSAHYDIPGYIDLMVTSAASFFQELYGLGARRIGVLSIPSIGCVPSQRTLDGGIERGCFESANQAAILFNSKLSSQMDSLNRRLPDARLVYLDVYNPLLALIQNPAQYGFEVANKGCCGTGNIEVSILCNHFSPNTCSDASKYIFWDSYHPSEQAYKILTPLIINKHINEFF